MIRFLFFFLMCFLPSLACQAASPWERDEDVAVRLVSATQAVGQDKSLLLGLEINLAPERHVYWRAPGPTGLPPSFDWEGSENLDKATLLFPTPRRFGQPPTDSIGYAGHVLMPLQILLQKPGAPLVLRGKLDLLVCAELCLPKTFSLALSLPEGAALPSPENGALIAAQRDLPEKARAVHITRAWTQDKTLFLTLESDTPISAPDVFLEGPTDPFSLPPLVKKSADSKKATLEIRLSEEDSEFDLPTLTATVVDGPRATTQALATLERTTPPPLWSILFLAFVGGFLLNFMPCVLPVLSLKLMSVLRHSGSKKRLIRHAFLSTASGIVSSFLVLAGLTLILKASGQALGWGAQFQQPLFLVFMIVLLSVFSASLWGVYEFSTPRFLSSLSSSKRHPWLNGDFASGAFATLLATPCTAPFLGTAVGFALTASWAEVLLIFTLLGLGMAVPFLLVAAVPNLARKLPRPGAWMEKLAHILGLGLLGTAVWLLFVLAAQIGNTQALGITVGMFAFLALLAFRHKRRKKFPRKAFYPLLGAVLLGMFGTAFFSAPAASSANRMVGPWTPYNEAALENSIAAGKTVFVNVSADWCLTCKANERFALTDPRVTKQLFNQEDIVALKADLTTPNPSVTAFLQDHGRSGIPFSIVFGPRFPHGKVLPEILTPSLVLEGLAQAACPVGKEC